jgi:hypothetical protein
MGHRKSTRKAICRKIQAEVFCDGAQMSVMVNQMEKTWSTRQIGSRSRNQGAKSAR